VNLVLWSIFFSSPGSRFSVADVRDLFLGYRHGITLYAYYSKYGGGATQREEAIQRGRLSSSANAV